MTQEEWRCAACDTPARFYSEGGICSICERVNDLLDVIAKHPEYRPQVRRAAWDIAKEVWRLAGGARTGETT